MTDLRAECEARRNPHRSVLTRRDDSIERRLAGLEHFLDVRSAQSAVLPEAYMLLQLLDGSSAGAPRYGKELGEGPAEADASIDTHRYRTIWRDVGAIPT